MKKNRIRSCEYSQALRVVMAFLLFAALVSAGGVFAAEEKSNASEQKNNVKEPTIVTSQKLTTDNKAHTALFEGNVVAKKGDRTMYADRMLVYYSEEKGGSNIKKIEADGNVKLVRGDRVVTSKSAVYYAEPEEYIVFTGDPRASQGENVITGTKITYFMKDDHSIVENSKVVIVNKENTGNK